FQKSRAGLADLVERLRESGVPVRDLAMPGETFPGWELLMPLIRPRNGSAVDLLERPIVILDEPEQIRDAEERLWKRLENPERPSPCPPEKVFFRWDELGATHKDATRLELRELEIGEQSLHLPTRPSMAFHGNMQVAIAEARGLVESGSRVAFFAASTGEVERLADIFNEYGIAYQLGMDQSDPTPQYLAERAYLAGSVASVYLIRGGVERGAIFSDAKLAVFGSEDLFETPELVARPAGGKSHLATFSAESFDLKPGDYVVHAEHGVGRFV